MTQEVDEILELYEILNTIIAIAKETMIKKERI